MTDLLVFVAAGFVFLAACGASLLAGVVVTDRELDRCGRWLFGGYMGFAAALTWLLLAFLVRQL